MTHSTACVELSNQPWIRLRLCINILTDTALTLLKLLPVLKHSCEHVNANLDNQSNRGLRDKTVKCYRERFSEPADTLGKVLMSEPKPIQLSQCSAGGFKRRNLAFLVGKRSHWSHVEAEVHLCAAGTFNGAQMLQVVETQVYTRVCMLVCAIKKKKFDTDAKTLTSINPERPFRYQFYKNLLNKRLHDTHT